MSTAPATGCGLAERRVLQLNEAMGGLELFGGAQRDVAAGQNSTFRLSPEPLYLDARTIERLEALGPVFQRFYAAANRLYQQSVRGSVPAFFHEYLDMGKSELVLECARLNRFRQQLPVVIRPDILLTDDGLIVTELDSVPGGMGLLGFLAQQYGQMGFDVLGGADGMTRCFAGALRSLRPEMADPLVAIVVSDESNDYRGEMTWLAEAMAATGLRVRACHPRELTFRGDGLYLPIADDGAASFEKVDILYRFFELFDLKNIPQIDLIIYAIRKRMVAATPPLKSYLEEKLLFALLHHPVLARAWQKELDGSSWDSLRQILPLTWVMDTRALPPHAVIPGLLVSGTPVTDFTQLATATQRERQLVIKPSGFSPEAWGSRGVVIGHDVPAQVWADKVQDALAAFDQTPHILQEFHKGKKLTVSYYDFDRRAVRTMHGRARLCPYYLVLGDEVQLAGVLATVVPLSKKAIHGMVDAVMVPVGRKA